MFSILIGFINTLSGILAHDCRFDDKAYHIGEKWYPLLGSNDDFYCTTCECLPNKKINCSRELCRNACDKLSHNPCCNLCTDLLEWKMEVTTFPTVNLKTFDNLSNDCLHKGTYYKDGEIFTSNSTNLKPHSPNQCVQCMCQTGVVICELETCYEMNKCNQTLFPFQKCCSYQVTEMSGVPFASSHLNNKSRNDCSMNEAKQKAYRNKKKKFCNC